MQFFLLLPNGLCFCIAFPNLTFDVGEALSKGIRMEEFSVTKHLKTLAKKYGNSSSRLMKFPSMCVCAFFLPTQIPMDTNRFEHSHLILYMAVARVHR